MGDGKTMKDEREREKERERKRERLRFLPKIKQCM
jgi:hypothetical protein